MVMFVIKKNKIRCNLIWNNINKIMKINKYK